MSTTETKPRQIKPSELHYKDYSDKAVPGDDPKKLKRTLTGLVAKKNMKSLI